LWPILFLLSKLRVNGRLFVGSAQKPDAYVLQDYHPLPVPTNPAPVGLDLQSCDKSDPLSPTHQRCYSRDLGLATGCSWDRSGCANCRAVETQKKRRGLWKAEGSNRDCHHHQRSGKES